MATFPLPIHSYVHTSKPVGCERLVNCFAEAAPPEGKAPTLLMRSPGINWWGTSFGAGPGRGIFEWNGTVYMVIQQSLLSMSSAGVLTLVGTIGGLNRVSWGVNSHQLVICASPDAYVYNGTALTQITDADYTTRGGAQVASIDNYVIFREPNTGRFFSSDLDDALSYNALMFATAEGYPDNIIGMIVDHRQIILAGANSIELWVNTGGSGFPFTRDTNGFIEIGCAAGDSFAKADNSVYWLANDFTVRRLQGYTPVRVSQHGVEQAIRSYATVSDAYGFGYTQDGHVFYVLTFPTAKHTWVLDVTTGEWHERETYPYTFWQPVGTAVAYGKQNVLFTDGTGVIGWLDPNTYTDLDGFGASNILRAEWTYGSVYASNRRIFFKRLEVLAETGVGLTTGQGSAPQMMLDVSDDGGRTWRALPNKAMGPIGEYRTLVHWDRLGSSFDRVFRNSVSDPVKVIVSDAQLETA
jgi:hypothetical protein